MSLKSELTRELKRRGLSLSDLQKKKHKTDKEEILAMLVRSGLIDGKSKTQLGKDIRATGFKSSNSVFRNLYDKFHINPKKVNPAKQKKSTKPRIQSIPGLGGKGAGKYLYIATLYCENSALKRKKKSYKKIPKNATYINPMTRLNTYNYTSEIGVWSDTLFKRNQIDILFLTEFWDVGADENSELTGSDYKNVLTSIDIEVIAFKYERVLKSE